MIFKLLLIQVYMQCLRTSVDASRQQCLLAGGGEILAEDEVVINPGVTKREEVKLPTPIPPVAAVPVA